MADIVEQAKTASTSSNPVLAAWGRAQLQRSSAGDPITSANTSVGPTPAPSTDAGANSAVSSPIAGLGAAAPTPASASIAPSGMSGAGSSGGGAANNDPNTPVVFSGPNALRQGIGQRNPPNLSPALTGLRNIY